MDWNTHTMSSAHEHRKSAAILGMGISVLASTSCRKDPTIEPVYDGSCRDFWEWRATGTDTLVYGESSTSYAIVLDGLPGYQGDCWIGLGFTQQQIGGSPSSGPSHFVYLIESMYDSIAYISNVPPNSSCQRTWHVGDSLLPSMRLISGFDLYYDYPGYCSPPNTVWYVGWVKLLGNRRHVGYIKVLHLLNPNRYVIDVIRLAKCPEQWVVIE